MASTRTGYPKFSAALYNLVQVMGETRPLLVASGMAGQDLAAFDGLYQVLTGQFALTLSLFSFEVGHTGTGWFPKHTQAS
jgi:hypothetical protein